MSARAASTGQHRAIMPRTSGIRDTGNGRLWQQQSSRTNRATKTNAFLGEMIVVARAFHFLYSVFRSFRA